MVPNEPLHSTPRLPAGFMLCLIRAARVSSAVGRSMAASHRSKLASVTLVLLFAAVSCSLPTGSYRVSTVIAQRCDADGRPRESIREDETISKHFYPFTPDGPFVTKAWPSRFEYSVVADNGRQQRLKFLTKREVYEQYLAFFPISKDRWIGIAPVANAPIEHSLGVCVFNPHAVLFSAIVAGCDHDDNAPLRMLRKPKPLRSTVRFYAYDFDPQREIITFATRNGRFILDGDQEKLQKVGE